MNTLAASSAVSHVPDAFCHTYQLSTNQKALTTIRDILKRILSFPKHEREERIKYEAGDYYMNTIIGDNPEIVYDCQGKMLFNDIESMIAYLTLSFEKYDYYSTTRSNALSRIEQSQANIVNYCDGGNSKSNQEYTKVVLSIKDEFINRGFYKNIEKLRVLTDDAFEAFCIRLVSLKVDELCALLHVLEFEKYSGTYINKNKDCNRNRIFENDNQMYICLEEVFGKKYKKDSFKKEFKSLKKEATNNTILKTKAWSQVEKMEKYYEDLKK